MSGSELKGNEALQGRELASIPSQMDLAERDSTKPYVEGGQNAYNAESGQKLNGYWNKNNAAPISIPTLTQPDINKRRGNMLVLF